MLIKVMEAVDWLLNKVLNYAMQYLLQAILRLVRYKIFLLMKIKYYLGCIGLKGVFEHTVMQTANATLSLP